MDVVLPGELDGIETASRIQASVNIPIIYLTANADKKILDRARSKIDKVKGDYSGV